MPDSTQPELLHVHRWVTYQTQYAHDWRLCQDCHASEQVESEAADRLKELMDLIHAGDGLNRIRGRMGHGRLNAGVACHLLATIDTTRPATRITSQAPYPAETREFSTTEQAASHIFAMIEQFAADSAEWKRAALEGRQWKPRSGPEGPEKKGQGEKNNL